ncbi:hypothetical protein F383_12514 [Gossypium arboreum]|uniref:Uncharacterized protein n=1 Tax=Gossypium arboreum TaxID=29729 RepID=A0A0B0N8K1_GOSAR|nr:hypothetical protein F383_12514 [Gossypium arboreum]
MWYTIQTYQSRIQIHIVIYFLKIPVELFEIIRIR